MWLGKKTGAGIRAIVFVVLFAVLFRIVQLEMVNKSGGDIRLVRSFYSEKKDSLDVIVLGSSHAYYGFQPNVLWDEYGLTSYVLGSPQQTVICSYYLLKEALRRQKPKAVCLESYYLRVNYLTASDARLHGVADNMRWGPARRELLRDTISDRPFKDQIEWYVPLVLYHDRWQTLEASDFTFRRFAHGSKITLKTSPMVNMEAECEAQEIPKTTKIYLDRIISLCQEEGIPLIVFSTPMGTEEGETSPSEHYLRLQKINAALAPYLEERGVPFLQIQQMDDSGIDYRSDFKDVGHLNVHGSEKVTKLLGKYIQRLAELPSHKGEPGYESWAKDYQDYRNFLEELGAEQNKEEAEKSADDE